MPMTLTIATVAKVCTMHIMYRCVFVLSAIAAHNGQAMAEINGANKERGNYQLLLLYQSWSWYFTNGNK
jgi:hypothetical protein